MAQKQIHLIAAARPNFMKVAPLFHALRAEASLRPLIIHTGQHYDVNMSDAFFQDLELPAPDYHLGIGSGTHAEQTGKTMIAYESLLASNRPDMTVVVGDVNATVACTLAAVKLGVSTAHLEAGLRSFDRTMPEEINRIVTDSIADLLWTPSPDGDENLRHEGIPASRIEMVGNIMIDSLELMRSKIAASGAAIRFGVKQSTYAVVTLHRPSNVDNERSLRPLVEALLQVAETVRLVFPVHPRTRKNLAQFGLLEQLEQHKQVQLVEPLGYIDFMNLVFDSRLVITDSGGIQEETTYLGIPCITLRENTERPITVTEGTNKLSRAESLVCDAESALKQPSRAKSAPALWDGKTAQRVVTAVKRHLSLQ